MIATLAAQSWGLFILRGIIALLFGIVAFVAPGPTFAALVLVFAFYAVIDGVLAIGVGLGSPTGPRLLLIIGGILGVAIGAYTFANPSITATAMVLLVGAFILVRGISELAAAITWNSAIRDAWMFALSGVVSILFGGYVLVLPGDGALALVYVVGFYALFAGVMYLALGVRLHGLAKTLTQATTATPAAPTAA